MAAYTGEQLAERIKVGEAQAFIQLYHQYKHRVYAYCYRLLRHPQNAEDATQETFIKVHRSLHQLENPSSFQTWIFTIARNEAFTLLRRVKPVEELEAADNEVWEDKSPLDRIVERERAAVVQHCLGLLRPAYRDMLILREYEHLSYTEIARVTGSSESAVKSALFKARKAMGRKLESMFDERDEQ